MKQTVLWARLMCWLVLFCISEESQLVTWNGTTITGPVLIYHDEIVNIIDYSLQNQYSIDQLNTSEPGALVCKSEHQATAGWRSAGDTVISVNNEVNDINNFRQLRTKTGTTPSVSRLIVPREDINRNDDNVNGLWSCRINGRIEGSVYVGLYRRGGGGRGPTIQSNNVSLEESPSFMTDPPTFTLFGDASGGPPTTYSWTRNGVLITDNSSFNITIAVNDTGSFHVDSTYRSTLTVTGRLPGVYQYSVSNRATPTMVNSSITIEGSAPTDLVVRQTGSMLVTVSWTTPSPPPNREYRITIDSTDTSGVNITSGMSPNISHNLSLALGPHTIRVVGLSSHLPSEAAGQNITVLDLLAPVNVSSLSLPVTSVNIAWTQPDNSLPADEYQLNLTLINGSFCASYPDIFRTNTTSSTSFAFSDLQESFTYSIVIRARHNAFGITSDTVTTVIETSAIPPTGPPQDVMYTITSRNVSVTWSNITCIERNGKITGYAVEFGPSGGANVIMQDTTPSFTRNGLTRFTDYTFRVAGVNSAGIGTYSDTITIRTSEDSTSVVVDVSIAVVVTFLLVTIPYTTILILLVCYMCQSNKTKKDVTAMDMSVCAAYGEVSAKQTSLEDKTEGVYETIPKPADC